VPIQMVSVSASVNLTLHHKVQKFSSGTGSPGWSRKKGRKMLVCVCIYTCTMLSLKVHSEALHVHARTIAHVSV